MCVCVCVCVCVLLVCLLWYVGVWKSERVCLRPVTTEDVQPTLSSACRKRVEDWRCVKSYRNQQKSIHTAAELYGFVGCSTNELMVPQKGAACLSLM